MPTIPWEASTGLRWAELLATLRERQIYLAPGMGGQTALLFGGSIDFTGVHAEAEGAFVRRHHEVVPLT